MRVLLPATLICTSLLTACATQGEIPPSKHISQTGALKVHPGLLGLPVPPELQDQQFASSGGSNKSGDPMKMDETGLRVQRSVYFDLNSAEMKSDYEPALRAHARYLADHPQSHVRIEGNADERGSAEYNRRLGLKRAETVRATLVGHGAPEKQISIKTLGEANPKLTGHNEESWAENRRADVVYEKED